MSHPGPAAGSDETPAAARGLTAPLVSLSLLALTALCAASGAVLGSADVHVTAELPVGVSDNYLPTSVYCGSGWHPGISELLVCTHVTDEHRAWAIVLLVLAAVILTAAVTEWVIHRSRGTTGSPRTR